MEESGATFPAPGLRRPLVTWQRRLVARILLAGSAGIGPEAWRRTAGGPRFMRFLAERGLVWYVADGRIVVSDRQGLAEMLVADDE